MRVLLVLLILGFGSPVTANECYENIKKLIEEEIVASTKQGTSLNRIGNYLGNLENSAMNMHHISQKYEPHKIDVKNVFKDISIKVKKIKSYVHSLSSDSTETSTLLRKLKEQFIECYK